MSVIFILIACSMALALGFLAAYTWASNSGQFEDDYTPSIRMLFDDETKSSESKEQTNTDSKPRTNQTKYVHE